MKQRLFAAIGWLGAVTILCAFGLLSFGILDRQGTIYHALNLFGALGIVADAVYKNDWPPAFLNIVWFLVALASLAMSL